jgi:selenocysteine lyase/cysteine desulfurase
MQGAVRRGSAAARAAGAKRAPGVDYWDTVRRSIIGRGALIETPFGKRRLTYADYTASGRGVSFIEDELREALVLYGNTHTEDDATGIATSERLRRAEASIKHLVNAGPEHRLIAVGTGTTGAVHLLQQILGIYLPPAGRAMFQALLKECLAAGAYDALMADLLRRRPVVFVGPYEHHSNEVSWRECFAEVVEIELAARGTLDLDDLRRKVSQPEYAGRVRIGAFSAASNVSGVRTLVREVAEILHAAGALACFDFAAIAPYAPVDMRPSPQAVFDALYFSPHKFLGGPGSAGVLLIHERIYRADLPPTVGAGGTVDFVDFDGQEYSTDIEVREKPGTPGILQTIRAALAMELKERMGPARIARREEQLARRAHAALAAHPAVELLGEVPSGERLPIFSFNIRAGSSFLHPRYVAVLLNDLFGIQCRAGCSCAAPYGHRLLHIDGRTSRELRRTIMCGNVGLKPGWARVNFHFLHTDAEVDFLVRAILFVADHGGDFLPLYVFDIRTGAWRHRDAAQAGGDAARGLPGRKTSAADGPALSRLLDGYLAQAERRAAALRARPPAGRLRTTQDGPVPFVYVEQG